MNADVQICATRRDAPGRAEVTSYGRSAHRIAEVLRSERAGRAALVLLTAIPVVVGLLELRDEVVVAARAHHTAQLGARVWVARVAPGAIRNAWCAEHDPDRDGVVDCVATAVAGERIRVFPLRCGTRSPGCDEARSK